VAGAPSALAKIEAPKAPSRVGYGEKVSPSPAEPPGSIIMFVYLSARIFQKPHVRTSWKFMYMLPVAVARFSTDVNAINCILSVLWMTSFSHNGLTVILQRRRYVSSSSSGAGTGGEACCLRLPFYWYAAVWCKFVSVLCFACRLPNC